MSLSQESSIYSSNASSAESLSSEESDMTLASATTVGPRSPSPCWMGPDYPSQLSGTGAAAAAEAAAIASDEPEAREPVPTISRVGASAAPTVIDVHSDDEDYVPDVECVGGSRVQHWFFTINRAEGIEGEEWQRRMTTDFVTAMHSASPQPAAAVWQLEKRDREHAHVAVKFERKKAFAGAKSWMEAVLRAARTDGPPLCTSPNVQKVGTWGKAANYCQKERTRTAGPWYINQALIEKACGGPRPQAKKSKLGEIIEMIASGELKSEEEVGAFDMVTLCSHPRRIRDALEVAARLGACKRARLHEKKTVVVVTGHTGTGKTRMATTTTPGPYGIAAPKGHAGEKTWFDGIQGMKTWIFEEMSDQTAPNIHTVKLLTDGGAVNLPTKGGHANSAGLKEVWFTSNHAMRDWWPSAASEDRAAIERRITKHYVFPEDMLKAAEWCESRIGELDADDMSGAKATIAFLREEYKRHYPDRIEVQVEAVPEPLWDAAFCV